MIKIAITFLLFVVLAIEIYLPIVNLYGFCQLWRQGLTEKIWIASCGFLYLGIIIGTVLAFVAELYNVKEDEKEVY